MDKKEINENKIKNLLKKGDINKELQKKFNLKKNRLLNTIKIEKINLEN